MLSPTRFLSDFSIDFEDSPFSSLEVTSLNCSPNPDLDFRPDSRITRASADVFSPDAVLPAEAALLAAFSDFDTVDIPEIKRARSLPPHSGHKGFSF